MTATTFFQQQAEARHRTSGLLFLYALAVIGIIASIYLVIYAFWASSGQPIRLLPSNDGSYYPLGPRMFEPVLFFRVAVIAGVIIAAGTLYKIWALSRGGAVIAAALGGRLVDSSTKDFNERKILNVVEEMSIASGVPVPPVYILDDECGINAFAAGFTPSDAVIGVTNGSITNLTRSELQGVIGHEFSHILNGDMRLNIKLIGLLHGILVIGLIGAALMRTSANLRSDSDDAKAALALFLSGIALFVIGYVGVFFGRLIKSAVSRQREYLADSSSVQFTRNPRGLAGALLKIAGLSDSSRLDHAHAEQASHMFFADALLRSWFSIYATHPPLTERIKRIDPSFSGDIPSIEVLMRSAEEEEATAGASELSSQPAPSQIKAIPASKTQPTPTALFAAMGNPSQAHIDYASNLIQRINPELREASQRSMSACCVIYALVLHSNAGKSIPPEEELTEHLGDELFQVTKNLLSCMDSLTAELQLPLVDLCMPALKTMSLPEYQKLSAALQYLIEADNKINFFEYTLSKLTHKHLDALFVGQPDKSIRFKTINEVSDACVVLLSHFAVIGGSNEQERTGAFSAGMSYLNLKSSAKPIPASGLSFEHLDDALDTLARASFEVREAVMGATARSVASDGRIQEAEVELLRAIGSHLDCPVPPYVHVE